MSGALATQPQLESYLTRFLFCFCHKLALNFLYCIGHVCCDVSVKLSDLILKFIGLSDPE